MILVLCRVLISSLLVIRAAFKWGSGNKGRWSAYGIENYLKRLSSLPCMVRELCLDAGYVLIVSVINHITRRETNYITLWTDVAPAPCTSRQNHIHRSLHLPGQRELKNIWKEGYNKLGEAENRNLMLCDHFSRSVQFLHQSVDKRVSVSFCFENCQAKVQVQSPKVKSKDQRSTEKRV